MNFRGELLTMPCAMQTLVLAALVCSALASLQADPPAPQIPQQFRALLLVGFTPYVVYLDAPNAKARIDAITNLTQENGVWKLEVGTSRLLVP